MDHPITKEERLRNIIRLALLLLQDEMAYGQNNIVKKLSTLGYQISPSSFSNIKKGKAVGLNLLNITAKGMQLLIERELGLVFDGDSQNFKPQDTPNWVATIVPEKPQKDIDKPGYILHIEGRVIMPQKSDFIDSAQREVIEVGARLRSFSRYFFSENETAYKHRILKLLKRGVDVKSYLLDPDSNEARIYFDDRAKVQSFEKESPADIKKVLVQLKELCDEFESKQMPGKFEIYLYKHIPYGLFLSVDGSRENGKMMVSPYLYGIRRADCPVLEITRYDQPVLFRKYWESLQLFLDGAKKLTH